ncbi:hypothetical protein H4R35_007341, partial [Dimargaris xerosporica]
MATHGTAWWASLPRLVGACVCTIVQACIPQRSRSLPIVGLLRFLYQLWQEEHTNYKGPWTANRCPAVEPTRSFLRRGHRRSWLWAQLVATLQWLGFSESWLPGPKGRAPSGLQQSRVHAGYRKPTKSHAVPWCVTYTFRHHRPTTTVQTLPIEVLQRTFGWLPNRQDH